MISKRLERCAFYTKGFHKLADIGTDHALVPVFCIKNHYVLEALAIDNKQGPLKKAVENINDSGFLQIKPILSSGIKDIGDSDVVLIAGMGGILIKEILNENLNNLNSVKRLILAPNNETKEIRLWGLANGFSIVDEEVVFDKNHYYEILVLEHGNKALSLEELTFGPILLKKKSEEFLSYLKKELNSLNKIPKNHLSLEQAQKKEMILSILNK